MTGDIEIRVNLTDEGAKNDLILDWRTTQFANDKDKPFAEVVKVNESIVKETVPNGVFDYQTIKGTSHRLEKVFENGRKCFADKVCVADKIVGRGGDALC